ncbi:hypothetical protein P8C59_001449 [Phyllachora maydis]|uniref:Ketoreductase domain-containing protein n=1 Tax=Phyllachora maydis TaxID=1825666 RepID=A0AAD9HYE7_9PEZI|nr:hypothetical protein P8C59_001449 [Phyllachora maydis]
MPIPFIISALYHGLPPWFPDPWLLLKCGSAVGVLGLIKRYTSGAISLAERDMHGRVVLITGGTSGIGAAMAHELARRGAQLVLLTRHAPTDPFLVEFVDDLRARTANDLVYAEQVDLASLHSIRRFATRWIDNAPPRRLDALVLCAATQAPPGTPRPVHTPDGVEATCMINYLANFHLLGLLSPAIRAQPFDRDVRIILPTCTAYAAAQDPLRMADPTPGPARWSPAQAYARSKFALLAFGHAYQKHLDAHKRPDGLPNNARVVFADPGLARTPGTRRWLTRGTLLGLLLYLVLWPLAWLLLKSARMGAQSLLFAAMDAGLGHGVGGRMIKECIEVDVARKDVKDPELAKKLWEWSDKYIEDREKEAARTRARSKKEEADQERRAREEAEKREKLEEIESLVGTIRKGKEKQAAQKATKATKAKKGQKLFTSKEAKARGTSTQ